MLKKSIRLIKMVVLCGVFLNPCFIFAQIEITEIMYDLAEGSDGGREWIEVYNTGGEVDLKDWRLFEAETNHKINPVSEGGNTLLSANVYAIIVDNFEKFKIDHPDFSGFVFDSAFSLSNTGENLILRNSDLMDIDNVAYSADWGANGDGNSLQKIAGTWVVATPTPGMVNSDTVVSETEEPPQENTDEENIPSTLSTPPPTTSYKIEPQVFADIIIPRDQPIAGADFMFGATSRGLKNEPLENASYQWTFGDGSRAQGPKVLHAYQYPGEYMVVLEVISGKYVGSDRLKIKVLPSDIMISDVGLGLPDEQFIELSNPSSFELNLSWWHLKVGDKYFTFPKDTIILPKRNLKLSSRVTNLFLKETDQVSLLYPNGSIAFVYQKTPKTSVSVLPQKKEEVKTVAPYQTATIQKAIEPVVSQVKIEEVEREETIEDLSLAVATTSLPSQAEKESKDSLFNKWNISLLGMISLAVAGVVFTNKFGN